MDFFKRFFPRKEPSAQGLNENRALKEIEIFVEQPSQSNTNLNDLDSSNKDFSITDPLQVVKNFDHNTQNNFTSTEISLNNTEPKCIDEIIDVSKNETILNKTNNNEDTSMKDVTCVDEIKNKESEKSKKTTLDVPGDAKDDDTMKNLKEFEDTLKEFDKTCSEVNCGQEIIDLDEFEDILGQLDCCDTANRPKVQRMEGIIDDLDTSKVSLATLENVDIISIISSTDDAKSQIINTQELLYISSENETHLDGYNSSDFEFITEEEANMDGFIININKGSPDLDNSSISSSEPLSNYVSGKQNNVDEAMETQKTFLDPEAGPSGVNKQKHEFEDRTYRNNHVLPAGDEYLGLFRGIYNPLMPVCDIIFLENKSVRASAMNAQYDGIGFDKQLMHKKYKPDSSEDEFEDEAKKCAQKILRMYPGENRKRRRRF